jgi:hypothetical protein
MAEHGVADRAFAELPCHRDMLRVIQILPAEKHHFPLQEGVPHRVQLRGRERFLQIDSADLGANVQRQRGDDDADGLLR